ncbi:MAG: glycerol-3-phosphate acyltransferase [Oscillospiraceae bacterium]|nr:glycerol-3-phosphate acyltransferase [Oscillospiraceae bacterium]
MPFPLPAQRERHLKQKIPAPEKRAFHVRLFVHRHPCLRLSAGQRQFGHSHHPLARQGGYPSAGSGNAGTTNVLREEGKWPAALTLLGDLLKSVIAVLLGWFLMTRLGGDVDRLAMLRIVGMYTAGLGCIIGHIYPLYFRFRGGKGIAAALGLALVLDWRVALISLGVFIVVVLLSRYVSLGSVAAALTFALTTFLFYMGTPAVTMTTVLSCLIAALLIFKHRGNIVRLCKGTEHKIGTKKKK